MSRTKQKLINYNTSGSAIPAFADVQHGEIVVRWATNQPELLIKIDSGETEAFAVFKDALAVSNMIQGAISGANQEVATLKTNVSNLSAATDTFINTTAPDTYLSKTDAANIYLGQSATTNYYTKTDADEKFLTMASAQTTYATSGDVVTAINSVDEKAETNKTAINGLDGRIDDLESFSGYVFDNYATKQYAETQASNAKDSAISSAETYVTTVIANYATSANVVSAIQAEKTRAEGAEAALDTRLDTLEGTMNTITGENGLSATVIANKAILDNIDDNYETKSNALTKYTSAVTYVDTVSGNIETYIKETYWTSATTKEQVDAVNTKVTTLSGSVIANSGAITTLSGDVVSYIDTKLSTVYKYQGSVDNYEALTAITEHEVGDVYNVVSAHGNIGDNDYTPAGTNYAWNGTAWDALGGTIDLSTYATKSDVSGITNGLSTKVSTLETNIGTLETYIGSVSGDLKTLSGKVVSDYYTKTVADETFLTIANANEKYYTSGQVESTYLKISDANEKYWTSSTTKTNIDAVNTKVNSLSSTTETIKTKANNSISAVTTGAVLASDNNAGTDEYASGVKIKNDNTNRGVTFDFSELVIDCGDF